MKRILVFCIAFFAIVLLAGRADFDTIPGSLTVNDGYATYYLTLTGLSYAGNFIYTASLDPPGSGVAFFDASWDSFVIKVFEDAYWWGYTYEGHWTGNCSTGYGVNNVGSTFSDSICLGPVTLSSPEMPRHKVK